MSQYYRTLIKTQAAPPPIVPLFIFEVKTDNAGTSGSNQFTMPILGTADPMKVDWGDGNVQTITAATTHTYAVAGIYEIQVQNCKNFRFNNAGDRLKLLEIKQVEGLTILDFGVFSGCTNMTWTATDAPNIQTANLSSTFRMCTNFNGNINNWDVSGVLFMSETFRGCSNFNQPLNNWNTSNIENMNLMFFQATNFNQSLNNWNTSSVTNMNGVFYQATNFNQPLNNWNTSLVTSMSSMIRDCTFFNQDLSGWCVELIASLPTGFGSNCPAWVLPFPNWGAPC